MFTFFFLNVPANSLLLPVIDPTFYVANLNFPNVLPLGFEALPSLGYSASDPTSPAIQELSRLVYIMATAHAGWQVPRYPQLNESSTPSFVLYKNIK